MTEKNSTLTQERLKELLQYDSSTGFFTWKIVKGRANLDFAGYAHPSGYVHISVDCKNYLAHRLAWLYVYGAFPENQIDHINHIRHDNRIKNLRCVTCCENAKNQSINTKNTSGIIGVSLFKETNKWGAYIRHKGRKKHLGTFSSKEEAITARKEAENKYGYHENHGLNLTNQILSD